MISIKEDKGDTIVDFKDKSTYKIFSTEEDLYLYKTNKGTDIYKVNFETNNLNLEEHYEDVIDTISFLMYDSKGKMIVQSKINKTYYNGADYHFNSYSPLMIYKNSLFALYTSVDASPFQNNYADYVFEIKCLDNNITGKHISLNCSQQFLLSTHTSASKAYFVCKVQKKMN